MRGKLNKKQAAFVREYLIDQNATQAAIRAGYSPNTAYSSGQRLTKHVDVKAAIDKGRLRLAEKADIKAQDVIDELRRIALYDPARAPDEGLLMLGTKADHKIRALEDIGKYLGMWVDRKEVSGPDGQPIGVEHGVTREIIEAAATCRAYMIARQEEIRAEERRRKALGEG